MDFNRKYLNGHRIAGFRRAGGISIGYGGCGGAGCSVAENGLWYVVAVNGNIYAIPAFLLIALIFRRKHQNIIGIGLILLISGGIVLFSYATTPAQAEQIEIFYQLNDHLDTPVRVADQYGNLVNDSKLEPFGNVAYEYSDPAFAYENNFRFPGQYHDRETGLYYNWNRYYVPGFGRYIRADQVGAASKNIENPYIYAISNPSLVTDFKGLSSFDKRKCKELSGNHWLVIALRRMIKGWGGKVPNFGCGATISLDTLSIWWCPPAGIDSDLGAAYLNYNLALNEQYILQESNEWLLCVISHEMCHSAHEGECAAFKNSYRCANALKISEKADKVKNYAANELCCDWATEGSTCNH